MSIVITCLLLFLSTCMIWLWLKTRRRGLLPPGPPTLPFIGNLYINTSDLLTNFRKYRTRYGDIYSLILGTQTVIVISGISTIKELFIKHGDVVSERPDTFLTRELMEFKGLSASSGELWKTHRTFALTSMRKFGFRRNVMEGKILEEVNVFIESIKSHKGDSFDISSILNISVSNIICSIAFGRRFNHDDGNLHNLTDMVSGVLSNHHLIGTLQFFPFLKYLPGDPFDYKKMVYNVEKVSEFLRRIINDHKTHQGAAGSSNYLDAYIEHQQNLKDKKNTFTDDQLLKTLLDMFSAGTETTVTSLRWFILILLHKPKLQDRMRAEVIRVVGESNYPTLEDRRRLPFCDSVIYEVLRFGNIGPMALPHGLSEDLMFRGYLIPKHAMLIPSLDSVLSDPKIFTNPSEFVPTRFLSKEGILSGTENVISFGVGRRVCFGEALARAELFLFATSLVQRFKLLPSDVDTLPPLEKYKLGITRSPLIYKLKALEYI